MLLIFQRLGCRRTAAGTATLPCGADIEVNFLNSDCRAARRLCWKGNGSQVVETLQVWSETGPTRWRNSDRRRQHISSQAGLL